MNLALIFTGQATLEDLYILHDKKNYDFTIEDGKVTGIYKNFFKAKV